MPLKETLWTFATKVKDDVKVVIIDAPQGHMTTNNR